MSGVIDDLAKALASGASRLAALAGLLTGGTLVGGAFVLPWTNEAKKKKTKKKKKKKTQTTQPPPSQLPPPQPPPSQNLFAKFQGLCDVWCRGKFSAGTPAATSCIEAAKIGLGPCYSATEEGPGFHCLGRLGCTAEQTCCPGIEVDLGQPVTGGSCCLPGFQCLPAINGTGSICI